MFVPLLLCGACTAQSICSVRRSAWFPATASSPTRSLEIARSGSRRRCRNMAWPPGDRVAYLSFNNHQLLEGYYGVVQARAIVMPLNVRLSETELTTILCHSGAKMLMFENDFAPMIAKLRKSCPGGGTLGDARRQDPGGGFLLRGADRPGTRRARRCFQLRRNVDRGAVLHQRQHGYAEGRDAGASHTVRACARYRRFVQRHRDRWWTCIPFRCSTPMAGAARRRPPCTASSR